MDKRGVYLIAAIILALTAIFLIHSYVQSERQKILELAKRKGVVEVVVAKKDIPAKTKISSNMLALVRVPSKRLEPEALSSIDSIVGKIAKRDIIEGEQIKASLLMIPGSQKTLSLKIPEGKRAITIPVDKISSIEGMIRPGDSVDIVGSFSIPAKTQKGETISQTMVIPMFEDVLVLAVGTKVEAVSLGREEKGPPTTITLALTPEQASLITYATEIGKIKLLLRSKFDTQTAFKREPVTIDKLWEKLLGIKQVIPTPPPPPKTVEVYKGTEKSSVVVEKE
ncbi:MAG: Flp pilus assembly protein CpaB [Candidatus Duberdicusella sinuisediminis]|nr:MAG: Flp pilus assembly protein CpaB [Candidatus Omnitrophota bacterium]